jgi:hypothetical protein
MCKVQPPCLRNLELIRHANCGHSSRTNAFEWPPFTDGLSTEWASCHSASIRCHLIDPQRETILMDQMPAFVELHAGLFLGLYKKSQAHGARCVLGISLTLRAHIARVNFRAFCFDGHIMKVVRHVLLFHVAKISPM